MAHGSKTVIYAALAGNAAIAVMKFTAAAFTGSAAMLSEGIHSVVDTGNQGLILYGMRQARRKPDARHPFGYGMELYFWTFVVAILIFAVGAGLSIYEGIQHIRHPVPMTNPEWSYVVLSLSLVFEGVAWVIAFREFEKQRGRHGYLAAVERSKDPTVFTVLFEDTAAVIGLLIAFVGIAAAQYFDEPVLDGVASLAIGGVLAAVAVLLARESKGLLIGESVDPEVLDGIRRLIGSDRRIVAVNEVLTMHLGPQDVLLAISIDFVDGLVSEKVEEAISSLERRVVAKYPQVRRVFIEAQNRYAHRMAERAAARISAVQT
ncbi:cation diffusion facilitator family transporter [Thalassobaculum sp.]|uniref:cation diffusion facilitator family transporter n=1 Tax=Thalassobaculum sp. TaxID=2022740 RepID=UPI0032EC4E51